MPDPTLVAFGGTVVELGPWRPVHWWLALAVAVAAAWVLFAGQHRRQWADRDFAWLLWHWFTGGRLEPSRSLPGFDGDNAQPGPLRRVLLAIPRTALPAVAMAGEYVRSGAPHGRDLASIIGAGLVGTAGLAAATWLVVYVASLVAHYRQWVRPLHKAVCEPAGWDEMKRTWRYIKVPRNRAEGGNGKGVRVGFAPNFDLVKTHKETVENIVKEKLDIHDVSVKWVPAGRHSYVQFRPEAKMPERAMFTDPAVRQLVADAKESAPLIGLTRGDKPVAIDLDTESPHILISAGTGGGKSSTAAALAAQLMHHGAGLTIIDIKRHSHQWARGIPGVTIARDLGEIHRVLVDLGREGHRRNRAYDDIDLDDEGPVFHRHVIVCEEMNATMAVLRQWWKNHKSDPSVWDRSIGPAPPESPAVRSLAQLLFMGRAVRIHVIAVAQMATAKDMGGPELRENFATRILARHTERAWRMLVPECSFVPATRHPGRMQVCIGGIATATQGLYMTAHQARAWAGDQRQPELDVADVAGRGTLVHLGKQAATVAEPGREPAVSLTEASIDLGRGIVDLSYHALRKARERDPDFPPVVGRRGNAVLVDPQALQRWELNRPRAVIPRGSETPDNGRNDVDEVDGVEPPRRTEVGSKL